MLLYLFPFRGIQGTLQWTLHQTVSGITLAKAMFIIYLWSMSVSCYPTTQYMLKMSLLALEAEAADVGAPGQHILLGKNAKVKCSHTCRRQKIILVWILKSAVTVRHSDLGRGWTGSFLGAAELTVCLETTVRTRSALGPCFDPQTAHVVFLARMNPLASGSHCAVW